jgi:hypothetical protein
MFARQVPYHLSHSASPYRGIVNRHELHADLLPLGYLCLRRFIMQIAPEFLAYPNPEVTAN